MEDDEMVEALTAGLVVAIRRVHERAQAPVLAVELDLYPWHQYVALSVLDAATATEDHGYPADWALFEVASSADDGTGGALIDEWAGVAEAMDERWDEPEASAHFHRLAARALTSAAVAEVLGEVDWAAAELRVVDADDPDGVNYAAQAAPPVSRRRRRDRPLRAPRRGA